MSNKYYEQLKKQKAIIEKMGYEVAYISVYGSQNYGLEVDEEDYKSDLDMKAIIVPTLDALVYDCKPVSKILKTEWGECDLKDIRKWTETLCKGNPTYIESLYTDYYIIDDIFKEKFQQILDKRDKLVYTLREQLVRAAYGMMEQKYNALTHPYPSIIHKIDKWGYDGKQAHHVLRLLLLIHDYFVEQIPYKECLTRYNPETKGQQLLWNKVLMLLKNNIPTLEEVKTMTKMYMERGEKLRNSIVENIDRESIDWSVKKDIIDISRKIIIQSITDKILIDLR